MKPGERAPRPLLSRFRGRFARGMLLLGMFLSVLPPVRLRAEEGEAPPEPPPVNDTWWGDVWRWIDGGQQWFAYQNVGEWGDDDGDDIPNGLDPYPWDASNNTGWLRASNVWSDAVLHETLEWAYAADRSWQLDWFDSDGDGLPNWCDPRPYDSANNTTWWNAQADVDGESRALSAIEQSDIIDWSDYDGDGLPNSFDPYPWDASNNTSRWSLEAWIDAILGVHGGMYASSGGWQDMDDDGLPDWADPYVDSAENNTSWWRGGSFYINGAEQWFGDENRPYATAWDDADHDGIPNFADPMPYDAANNTTWWSGEYQIDGSLRQLGGVFAAGGLDWGDYDSDGIPNFVDPYLYDSGNNNSNITAATDTTTSWYDSYASTMWQDWGDNDADGLPNFSDPYPNDATNNTTQWYAPQPLLVNGALQTPGGSYATDTLDWNDDDGDELPNFADPYPHDPDNNSALWWAQTWVDGAAQDLIGAYAANADTGTWSDGDEDGLPDWLDPYPEDADNNTAWWWGNAWIDGGMQDIAGTYAASESAIISWEDTDEDGLPDWLDPYPQDAGNNTAWWMDEAYVDGELQTLMASYAADAAPAMSWEDRDFDGLPDWCDPYADDFSNNTLWWEGEFLIDGERVTVSGWFADEGPDWNDDDGDWLPNFMDPYVDDASNNTAFWNGAAWIDGQWQEIAEPYPASSAALLDLSDLDEDSLPDVFDPYPEDATNNTAVWLGGEFVIDGEPRVLTGAGERYAADGGDVDGDHLPDFADPYPEDAGNDGREPVFAEPVAGESVTSASVDGASVGSASVAAGVSTPTVALSTPEAAISALTLAARSTGDIPAPSVPPPALDDAAVLALLSTGSLPQNVPQSQGTGTEEDETPPDPLSAATAATVEQLVAEIAELTQRPRTFNAEADAQALVLVVQTLVVEPGADPAAALAAALAFRQTPNVTAQDSDGDGLDDLEETLTYLTDLTNPDTDGDGFFDGWEIAHGLDPLDADDNTTADSDNDGLSNAEELSAGTHPLHADSDYGGVIDGIETRTARLRVLLGENTPQEYSAANPLDPQDDVPKENGPVGTVDGEHPEEPEDPEDDDTHSEQDEDDMGGADDPPTGGGTPPGSGNEGTDDEEAEQDGQDMDGPGQPPPLEEHQETLREKWAREKREREAVLQERRDRLHEEHVAGVGQRAAQREQQRELNHHLSHPHGNHGMGVKNAGSRGLFDSAQRPLAFEPTAQYALSHGFDNVTRTWLNPRPANESPEDRNTRLAQDWLERKALRDQQRVFWHPHGNHGNGVVNTGARGRYSADNLDGALEFQASEGYAQTQSYKDMLRRDYVRGIVDSVIAQEGGQKQAFTAAEKQALVRLLQSEDHAKPLSSYKIAAIARGALVVAEGADNLEAGGSRRLHALINGRGIADNGGSVLNPQSPAELLTALARKGEEPAYAGRVPAHHRYAWEDTDGDGVSNQDEWDLNTDPDDIFHTPTAADLAELERQRIEAAKTFADRQAERQAAERERLRLEAEAWQQTLETEHAAQREYELCHPELARQGTDRMLTENFTPIVKVDENGRPLMLVRRTGPDGQEVDVWATPKDQELADNFVKNSTGEWELRGEQERHRRFVDERFVSDYLAPAMLRAESSLDAFVEVNLTAASIVAGGAGVTGAAPRLIGMGKEALSEFTGLPVGFKDIKELFSRKALGQLDEVVGNAPALSLADDVATLKSIRRYSERLVQGKVTSSNASAMLDVRDIQAAIANGNYRAAGTGFHSLNFQMARDAQSRGFLQNLNIDQTLRTPGGFLPSRRPDYLFDGGGIYDIKPFRPSAGAYDNTRQFRDIHGQTGIMPVPLYYRLW